MTDKEISKLNEQEFDLLLEDIIDRPPQQIWQSLSSPGVKP